MNKEIASQLEPLLKDYSNLVRSLERSEENKSINSINRGKFYSHMIGSWRYFITALIAEVPEDSNLPEHILEEIRKTVDALGQEEFMNRLKDK